MYFTHLLLKQRSAVDYEWQEYMLKQQSAIDYEWQYMQNVLEA